MQITDILAQAGGLRSMARELGVSETQAASGAEALIPAILGGLKKQAQSQPSGLEGLGGLLGQLGGGSLLDGGAGTGAYGRSNRAAALRRGRLRRAARSEACWGACSAARPPAPAASRRAPRRRGSPRCST